MMLTIGLVILAGALLGALIRAMIGPSVADRAVGADVAFYIVLAALSILSVVLGSAVLLDVVLVVSLVGFVASVSLASLIGKPRLGKPGGRVTGDPRR